MTGPFAVRAPGHFARLDVSNSAYHSTCDGISNSMLSVALDDPALFRDYYVTRTRVRPPPTPKQVFGTQTHQVILDGADPFDLLIGDVVLIPDDALNPAGNRMGAAWKAFQAEHPGETLVKEKEIAGLRETAEILMEIRTNCERHPEVAELLFAGDGENETSVEWTDDATGLLLRSRRDRITTYNGRRVIVDVKTMPKIDPQSFASSVLRWQYHRQARFYQRGEEAQGETLPFVFVAVRNEPPYSVRPYDLDAMFLDLGEQELSRGLSDLAAARDSGLWQPPTAAELITVHAPRWAFNNEWSLE